MLTPTKIPTITPNVLQYFRYFLLKSIGISRKLKVESLKVDWLKVFRAHF